MLSLMSEKSDKVRLQIFVDVATRRRLKSLAAKHDLDMSELGAIVLDHSLGLMESGKTPTSLDQAIKQFVKTKTEAKGTE
ncbi:hypothetical protein [Gemmata sp.]|uniref:hypothetical protein n=1 Tax=Gemmata sp. TaxID=1914242 RepID=UPI003F703542